MAKEPTTRDLGLKSDSFSLDYPEGVSPRIIANVEADQKVGKTDFCIRYAPDPIILYNIDQGLEGVIDQHRRRGKQIVVAGVPTKDKSRFPSYHFARPVPMSAETRKSGAYLERVKKEAVSIWERFINDYDEGLKSDARTLVIDTGGGLFQLGKFAFHGMDKVTQKDDPYGQKGGELKSIFQGIVTDAYSYDKNVLWIHRLKDEWKGGTNTGGRVADGYGQIQYEVQVTLRLRKTMTRGEEKRTVEIRDSRLDTNLNGEVFSGSQYRFSTIAAMLTGTDEDVWE